MEMKYLIGLSVMKWNCNWLGDNQDNKSNKPLEILYSDDLKNLLTSQKTSSNYNLTPLRAMKEATLGKVT